MSNSKRTMLFIALMPFLVLSCLNCSSPTSDKSKTFHVNGIIVDKNNSGIGGVTVQITGANFSFMDTTDTGGAFSFNSVKAGDYKVKAMKDSCFFKPASLEFAVDNADIDTLKFTTADNYVHGRVLDIVTKKGIGDIKILMQKKMDNMRTTVGETYTDIDGEFGFFDLETSLYFYLFYPNYFIMAGTPDFSIEPTAFSNSEIILPDYYLSSENLAITKAEFIKETHTLNLEWKPSESEYISNYYVRILKNPEDVSSEDPNIFTRTGSYYVQGDNKNSRLIKYQDVSRLFDENTISGEVFLCIAPYYKIGNVNYYGPCSDTIKIQLYW